MVQCKGAGGQAVLVQSRGVQWLEAVMMALHRQEPGPATQAGQEELSLMLALCFLPLVYIQSWELTS